MRVYAVVSDFVQGAIDVFSKREEAEEFLEEVRADDPELAEVLGVEPIDLREEESPN